MQWDAFFQKYKEHRCPDCKRGGVIHNMHQATSRIGYAAVNAARRAPSEMRESIREELWQKVRDGPNQEAVEADMRHRAHTFAYVFLVSCLYK